RGHHVPIPVIPNLYRKFRFAEQTQRAFAVRQSYSLAKKVESQIERRTLQYAWGVANQNDIGFEASHAFRYCILRPRYQTVASMHMKSECDLLLNRIAHCALLAVGYAKTALRFFASSVMLAPGKP